MRNQSNLVQPLLHIPPFPSVIANERRPLLVVVLGTSRIVAKVDDCTSSKAFTTNIIDFPSR